MDPLSIASTVVALTATCLSTCKKLADLAGRYEEVPLAIATLCAESTVISCALSQLQILILQRDDLAQAWSSKTDIREAFEMGLNGCMLVFSCLEAETRQLQTQMPGSSGPSVWTKIKFMWNQDRLKELLTALRGQQTSINFLLQVLECRTLSDIQRDVKANKANIRASVADAQSVRSRNPSVMRGCQSIFDNDTHRLSMFADDLVSVVAAPSELNFEFDDFVLNSQAYRRVFAKAQAQNSREVHVQNITEDLIDFSEGVLEDSDTITIKEMNQDLVSLNLSLQGQSSVPSVSSTQGDTPSAAPIPRKPLATSTFAPPDQTTASVPKGRKNSRECSKCGEAISGQFVKAFEMSWHLECFTCHDCGKVTANKFFVNPDAPNVPLCVTHYFGRLDLLCDRCGEALRGDYITAIGRKFHVDHFGCDTCDVTFDSEDTYYEHEGQILCFHDYCRAYADRCTGCLGPITKQFIEPTDDDLAGRWHPECYLLRKHLQVTISPNRSTDNLLKSLNQKSDGDTAVQVYNEKHAVTSARIWNETSLFIEAVTAETTGLQELFSRKETKTLASPHWGAIVAFLDALWQAEFEVAGSFGIEKTVGTCVVMLDPLDQGFLSQLVTGTEFSKHLLMVVKFMLQKTVERVLRDDDWTEPCSRLDDFLSRLEIARQAGRPLTRYTTREPTRSDYARLSCITCSKPVADLALSRQKLVRRPGDHKWHPECWSCPACNAGPKKQQGPPDLHERPESLIFCTACRASSMARRVLSHELLADAIWASWAIIRDGTTVGDGSQDLSLAVLWKKGGSIWPAPLSEVFKSSKVGSSDGSSTFI